MSSKVKVKKEKNKISKLIEKSDSENDDNEHELYFYVNDRVKLMKEVLKIIKPKKIKSMAPECIKDLDIEEINSMLLEELLGISNKRLKYIFNGQNLGEDSSSTDPEEEKQPIDVISLDDVSEDDFIIDVDTGKSKKIRNKNPKEPKLKRVKKEKLDKKSNKGKEGPLQEENLMSVLELLELQARARAIRSQLMLEANKKTQQTEVQVNEDSDTDDVILEIPKSEEIVITSSDSETEKNVSEPRKKKITLVRDRFDKQKSPEPPPKETDLTNEQEKPELKVDQSQPETPDKVENNGSTSQLDKVDENNVSTQISESVNDEDEIILIVDQEEMDGIIGD